MIQKEVSAQVPEKKNSEGEITQKLLGPVTVLVNYAETLEEASELYGPEAILSNAFANWKVTLQSNVRSSLKSGLTEDQIQDKLIDAKMGVAQVGGRVDPQTAFIAKFKMATPEGQAEMLDMLRTAAEEQLGQLKVSGSTFS